MIREFESKRSNMRDRKGRTITIDKFISTVIRSMQSEIVEITGDVVRSTTIKHPRGIVIRLGSRHDVGLSRIVGGFG